MKRSGFSLVEALIVVAAVGTLALVTAPLYMQSTIAEDVALERSRLSEVEKALELYRIDNDNYPPWFMCFDCNPGVPSDIKIPYPWLTTPVDYVSDQTDLVDVFLGVKGHHWYRLAGTPGYWTWNEAQPPSSYMWDDFSSRTAEFENCEDFDSLIRTGDSYVLWGVGPDGYILGSGPCSGIQYPDTPYDPSNGTVSDGRIYHFGPRGIYATGAENWKGYR